MNPQMQVQTPVLPPDFDGTFRFTNWTTEDFSAKWDSKVYTFPALKTVPLIILSATPYEIQNIRKKFAKELAEREFFKSKEYQRLDGMNTGDKIKSFQAAVSYTPNVLESYVQKCLEPLPVAQMKVTEESKVQIEPKAIKRVKSKQSGDDTEESLVESQGTVVA